jgi:hypothetical protein
LIYEQEKADMAAAILNPFDRWDGADYPATAYNTL